MGGVDVKPAFAKRKTHRDALLDLLSDGAWHTMTELAEVSGYRYSARIFELRKKGHRIEKQTLGADVYWYRLLPPDRLL